MSKHQPDRDFAAEVHQEHEELRMLLKELHKVFADRLAQVAEVTEKLELLTGRIESHFEEEETAGLFDQIVERAPRLSSPVEVLRTEHLSLLKAIRTLNQTATDGDGSSGWWQRLEDAFHEFSKDLMHHEGNENQLLQQAYSEDIGAAD